MSETQVPDDVRYTPEHEWVQQIGDSAVRIGVTDYAQQALNDVVFVQLPAVDDQVDKGESFAELESTKSVSDIFGPLDGTVTQVNEALDTSPELVNTDPYGAGWLVEIAVRAGTDLAALLGEMLDADAYRKLID